jgi:hypothetical protein
VDVENTGDKPGNCTVDVTIEHSTLGLIAQLNDVPTGTVDGQGTAKILIDDQFHIDETWNPGTITITAVGCCGDPVTCDIIVTGGPYLTAVNIQQPAEASPCDQITISVDVENLGGKPGACDLIWEIWTDGGVLIASGMEPLSLDPQGGYKIVIWAGHVDESMVPGITVLAGACDDIDPITCHIVVIPPPPPTPPESTELNYRVDYTTPDGFPPPAGEWWETDWPIDVHITDIGQFPPDELCNPPIADVASVHHDANWNYGFRLGGDPYGSALQYGPDRGTSLYVYYMRAGYNTSDHFFDVNSLVEVFDNWKGSIPGVASVANWDCYVGDGEVYGIQPGWPYNPVPSERWAFIWYFGGRVDAAPIYAGCFPGQPYFAECHVAELEATTVVEGFEEPGGDDLGPGVTPWSQTYYDVYRIECIYTFVYWDDDGDARDSDVDGYCDGQEVVAGTNPNDPNDYPAVAAQPFTDFIDEDLLDGVDNDGDGQTDEDQYELDNDGDGLWNEDPSDSPFDDNSTGTADSDGPGTDNDSDGQWEEDVADGLDNDFDTLVDEDDVDPPFDDDGNTIPDDDGEGSDEDGDGLWSEDTPPTGPPPGHGYRTIWYDPDALGAGMGAMVKQINNTTPHPGTETWKLYGFTVAP